MFSHFSKNAVVPLLLRWALAAIFIFHGLKMVGPKDKGWGASWLKPSKASDSSSEEAASSASSEKPGPDTLPAAAQLAVAWGELLGGVALAFGFLTRIAALGIMAIMLGAVARIHWQNGFDAQDGGFEYNFAIMVMCLCLLLGGPGPFAIDRIFHLRRRYAPPPQS
jgi:uncharacterized membrane protein YphA (DoxX/SURF4 family)